MTGFVPASALWAAAALRTAESKGGGSASGNGTAVTTPRVPAREAAEHELAKAQYHQNDPSPLQRLVGWLGGWLRSLLDSAAQATPGGWTGLIAIAIVIVFLVVALRLRLGMLRAVPATTESVLFDNRPRNAAEHRAAAEELASAGRWSEALQERMRCVVRSLEERTLLEPRPGRTADEAATEAGRSLPEHADALRKAARDFDEVTYAARPANAQAYARMRDLDTALQRAKPHLTELDNTPGARRPSRRPVLNAPSDGGSR
jgi:hypothetical protein